MAEPYRIVHISDLHVWRFTANPLLWIGKRGLGLANLALRRAREFRREELPRLVEAIVADGADHVILSGDLTITSLDSEFARVRSALSPLLSDPTRATILPGNHDRYTRRATRNRVFESHFGAFCEGGRFPFLKPLAEGLDLIGFDPNVPRPFSAKGLVKEAEVARLKQLLEETERRGTRTLLFACHYPSEAPDRPEAQKHGHDLEQGELLLEALRAISIPIYWLHGHIHHPWRFQSPSIPNLTYLNPGAPLYRGPDGISLGRWILDWDGEAMRTEFRQDLQD